MLKAIVKFGGINQQGSHPDSTLNWSNGDSAVYPFNPIPSYKTYIKPRSKSKMERCFPLQINFQIQLLIIGDKL